jgi:hypothetical protein
VHPFPPFQFVTEVSGVIFNDLTQILDMPVDSFHVKVAVNVKASPEMMLRIPIYIYVCVSKTLLRGFIKIYRLPDEVEFCIEAFNSRFLKFIK